MRLSDLLRGLRRHADPPATRRAKLLLAGAAWLAGYDGSFEFENIGDSYVDSGVPYVAMRALPALFGSLIPPLVFATMRASGCSILASVLSTLLILLGWLILSDCQLGRVLIISAGQTTHMSSRRA